MVVISRGVSLMVSEKGKGFGKEGLETQISTKEATKMIENGVMVSLLGNLATFTKDNMKLTLEMVMDKCIGQTELVTKDIGLMAFNMALVIYL
jgi:hypothetical protein